MAAMTNLYRNLFAPSPAKLPAPAPRGGANWETGLVSAGPTPSAFGATTYTPAPGRSAGSTATRLGGTASTLATGMNGLFAEGVTRDWASAVQARSLATQLAGLNEGQLVTLAGLLNQAGTKAEQVFTLKALAAGEPWANLISYATEMRGQTESDIVRRSTMRDDADVIQQWQDACGPTVVQTIAGEADPRYAWELNKAGDPTQIAPEGAAKAIADQQAQWLAQYGGQAVERGRSGGQGIALGQLLNDTLSPLTKATYTTTEVTDPTQSLERVQQLLQTGYDVPMRIEWSPPGAGPGNGHFVLAMQVRGAAGAREFQIHDPWTGKTAWIREVDIAQNSFAPIFNTYARLTHTYEAQANA